MHHFWRGEGCPSNHLHTFVGTDFNIRGLSQQNNCCDWQQDKSLNERKVFLFCFFVVRNASFAGKLCLWQYICYANVVLLCGPNCWRCCGGQRNLLCLLEILEIVVWGVVGIQECCEGVMVLLCFGLVIRDCCCVVWWKSCKKLAGFSNWLKWLQENCYKY